MDAAAATTSARVKRCATTGVMKQTDHNCHHVVKKMMEKSIASKCSHDDTRMVKLQRNPDTNSKLGFSLRGGKEATGSSVGVFVSHVESCGEAHKKGLKLGDQLVRVNGLDVDRATYDEVIGIIKRSPKRGDILLEVRAGNLIPYQERSGQPIKWLQVVPDCTEVDTCSTGSSSSSSRVSISASDEGVDSCESNEVASNNWTNLDCQDIADFKRLEERGENSKSDAASSLDGGCCSVSVSSLASSAGTGCETTCASAPGMAELKEEDDVDVEVEVEVRVPGGQRTQQSFGCGVVKGPDEWPGIFVQNVKAGSLAERVGLEPGDQLLEADGSQLDRLAFETAIRLIKRLQQQQPELVLLVRKGAALKHLARRSTVCTGGSSPSACSGLEPTTWSSKIKEPETSGASLPIRPRVSLKWSTTVSGMDDDEEDEEGGDGVALAWRNPISGTKNQPTKRAINASKDNTASPGTNSSNDLSSSSSLSPSWDGSNDKPSKEKKLPAAAAAAAGSSQLNRRAAANGMATTEATKKTPQASILTKSYNCRGSKIRDHEQVEVSDGAPPANGSERESDRCEDEERIRIVSQNCKLHHQRRNLKHPKLVSVVVREKFPQLANNELPTSKSKKSHLMAGSSSSKSGYPAAGQQIKLTNAGSATGMQRYVSMDNLCLSGPDNRLQSGSYSHYSKAQVGANMSAEERFARIQQYRRRSNSVLGQPDHWLSSQCYLMAPRQQFIRQQPKSANCCNQTGKRIHWLHTQANYASQTLASTQLQVMASCQVAHRLHYRAQSVDKLNQIHHYQQPQVSQPISSAYLRRYVAGPQSMASSPSVPAASNKRRVHPANPKLLPECCSVTRNGCKQSLPAEAIYNDASTCMISRNQCCSSRQPLSRKTSSSYMNLREQQSIYLSCCPSPYQSACCCTAHIVRHQKQTRPSNRLMASNNSSAGDSSGYLSSGSLCNQVVSSSSSPAQVQQRQRACRPARHRTPAAPAPPPMITMELARVSQQQQQLQQLQQRDTRVQRLSTFVSGQQQQQQPNEMSSAVTGAAISSAGSDFSSFSPNPDSLSSSCSHLMTSSSGSDSSLLSSSGSNHHHDSGVHRHRQSSHVKPRQNFTSSATAKQKQSVVIASSSRLSPPRPPPLPMPDPEFECRIGTLKQPPSILSTSTTAPSASVDLTGGSKRPPASSGTSESESRSQVGNSKQKQKQQLDRLCFVDELKMLAQRGQQQSPSSSLTGTSATLFKTLKASKAANKGQCVCCSNQLIRDNSTGGCRLHDQQKKQPKAIMMMTTKNDKLNEEDNKRRQHEMLMKEFKSAHSRMFNKRRATTSSSESSIEEPKTVNNDGNYSYGLEVTSANNHPAPMVAANNPPMATKLSDNNCAKKGSISAVGSVQIATAN